MIIITKNYTTAPPPSPPSPPSPPPPSLPQTPPTPSSYFLLFHPTLTSQALTHPQATHKIPLTSFCVPLSQKKTFD